MNTESGSTATCKSVSGYHQRKQRARTDKPHSTRLSDYALLAHVKAIMPGSRGNMAGRARGKNC
ncbi:hypothetical protein D8I24_2792 (plasmid) [Cupriavidus necator H850]|nr:hypothetical protein D8I24_2792 [Cupriavidus necator H850]